MRSLPSRDTKTAVDPFFGSGMEQRWRLKRLAEQAMNDREPRITGDGREVAHFKYRVCMCHRGTWGIAPEIKRNKDKTRARFVGLQTCGSVWMCPICAGAISGERRAELQAAVDAWTTQGGVVLLATYTFSHGAFKYGAGNLQRAIDDLSGALRYFKGTRAYRGIMERAGCKGVVRALEVTFSWLNGWHVHTHELLFVDARKSSETDALPALWCDVLTKRGMAGHRDGEDDATRERRASDLLARACTVQGGGKAADYIAKFGVDESMVFEITHSHTKMAASEHFSPWALLSRSGVDRDAKRLFREYAQAFHGRRQLVWSRGLREFFFGVVARPDEDIAAAADAACTVPVCQLTDADWRLVLGHDARLRVLQIAALSGRTGVEWLLDHLRERPPDHGSEFTEDGTAFIPIRRAA